MIFSRLYTLNLTVLVVVAAILFHLSPDNFLADDAYFYPQIANQIVQGHGSTFHQYSFTNGYQPLWMIFSIIAAGIANGDKVLLLHILGVFQIALFVTTLYYLFNLTNAAQMRFFSVGLAFLTVLMLAVGGLRLFESHLAMALQMAAFYLFIRLWQSEPTANALAACSILLGLIFLARTDAFFLSASYGAALSLKILREEKPFSQRVLRVFAISLPAIFIALLYMILNKIAFGHPVPISGVIKSSFPHFHADLNALGMQGKYIVASTLAILLLSIVWAKTQKSVQALFGVAFAAVFLHAAYIICFSWGSQWHYTTAFTIFPVALQFILTKIRQHVNYPKIFSASMCLTTFMLLAGMVAIGYLKTYYHFSISLLATGKASLGPLLEKSHRLQLAEEINKHVSAGQGIAVYDSPGVLAYFSHARILPVDGLVNDREYDSYISSNGFLEYLKMKNIHYFLAPIMAEEEKYRSSTLHVFRRGDEQFNIVYAPIQGLPTKTFCLHDRQIIFEFSSPIPNSPAYKNVSVWHLE